MIPRTLLGAILATTLWTTGAAAQTPVKLSGLAYLDYAYVLDDPTGSDGDNGFSYRRLYLTGDFGMSEHLSFRARLEAADSRTNEDGLPMPFVKDLYVRWDDALGEGHDVFMGVSSPPAYETSEGFFGYRSLEKTQMDLRGIVSSRDFGVKVRGPLVSSGKVKYAAMFGNNSSVQRETDRNKRVYGQLEFAPTDELIVTVGGDYAAMEDGSTITANAFAGYRLERMRFGVEAFLSPISADAPLPDTDRYGLSLFGALRATDNVELLLRYDRYATSTDGADETADYALAGAAVTVESKLRIIPNLVLDRSLGVDDPMLTARITVEANF